ncbi:MAG: glycosyltransferase family 39 protein [Chloroflexi bacterium]|nr:glycosyltransferase family 39 protein [Chloroflexota bacterium]
MQTRTVSVPTFTLRVATPTWPAETVVLGAILVSAAFMRLVRLSSTSGDLDEGIRGIQLLLMSAGYRPVQEIYSSQGPLLLNMLFPLYQLFGETLGAARLAVGVYSLIGILGIYWVARAFGGPVGGATAALLLVVSPGYLRNSRQALAEVPALAPAILAVAAALAYQRSGRRIWLVVAGVLLGIGLLVKPIVIAAVVAVGLAALLGPRISVRPVFLVGTVTLAVVVAIVLTAGLPAILSQMVDYRLKSRDASGWNLAENWTLIQGTLLDRDQVGIFALAGVGALVLLLASPRRALPYLGWAAASIAILLFYAPLFPKHVVIAIPPVAALAGAAVGHSWQAARARRWQGIVGSFLLAAPVLLYLWSLPAIADWNIRFMNLDPGTEGQRFAQSADVAGTIASITQRGDFVITDHPYLAFLAQRLVPPDLADPSKTRVRARELTGDDIITAAQEYDARVVVLWSDRLRTLKSFRTWLDDRFEAVKVYAQGGDSPRVVYVRDDVDMVPLRRHLEGTIQTPTAIDFGGVLRLAGFSLDRHELTRVGNVGVTYEWQALARASVDYHIISELIGPDGQSWSDEELSFGNKNIGLIEWTPGRWVLQASTFDVPPDAPSGEYVLHVGVYDSRTKANLPISAGDPRLGSSPEPLYRFEVARLTVK